MLCGNGGGKMVLRLLLLLLFSLSIFADVQYGFVRYTGTGGDTIIECGIDSITLVIVQGTTPTAGAKKHPRYLYLRPSGFDSLGTAFTPTSFTKDSICWFGPNNNATTYSDSAIKKWYWPSDSILLGQACNMVDTSYFMWIVSDPDGLMMMSNYYAGDGTDPHTITTTGYSDTLEAAFILVPVSFAHTPQAVFYANATGNSGYFWDCIGERRPVALSARPIGGSFDVHATYNTNTYKYVWFGFKENDRYVRVDTLLGDADPASNDTIPYNPVNQFRAAWIFGSGFPGITTVTNDAMDGNFVGHDTSFTLSATIGSTMNTTNSAWVKDVIDSMIVRGDGDMDQISWNKILAIGDTTAFEYLTPPVSTGVRQPCEGNVTIQNKGNLEEIDRYK